MKRDIPGVLWISIAALALFSLLTLFGMLRNGSLALLGAVTCNIVILIGLVMGKKWAYALTLVFSVLGAIAAFAKGPTSGLSVLAGNALVVVPVLLSTSFFFPPEPALGDK